MHEQQPLRLDYAYLIWVSFLLRFLIPWVLVSRI